MTAVDRLTDLHSASRPATPRRRTRTTDHIGAFLTAAFWRGDEILAGTAAFPPANLPRQRYPVRCDLCPATWVIGDIQPQAEIRLANHAQQSHL